MKKLDGFLIILTAAAIMISVDMILLTYLLTK